MVRWTYQKQSLGTPSCTRLAAGWWGRTRIRFGSLSVFELGENLVEGGQILYCVPAGRSDRYRRSQVLRPTITRRNSRLGTPGALYCRTIRSAENTMPIFSDGGLTLQGSRPPPQPPTEPGVLAHAFTPRHFYKLKISRPLAPAPHPPEQILRDGR